MITLQKTHAQAQKRLSSGYRFAYIKTTYITIFFMSSMPSWPINTRTSSTLLWDQTCAKTRDN